MSVLLIKRVKDQKPLRRIQKLLNRQGPELHLIDEIVRGYLHRLEDDTPVDNFKIVHHKFLS